MDEKIEQMAKEVCPLYPDYESCEQCDAELDIDDEPCVHKCFAKAFYNAGYRKASDVAKEIFDWLENSFVNLNFVSGNVELNFGDYLNFKENIKKKYTGEN